MSVTSEVLNCHSVKKRNLTVPTKAEVSKKPKETFEEARLILFKENVKRDCFLTLLFFLWTTANYFFLIKSPTSDRVYFFLSELVNQFTLLRRAMTENQVQAFVVSFLLRKNNLL